METHNSHRRPHKILELCKKAEIIGRLNKGESAESLAAEFEVCKRTIQRLRRESEGLLARVERLRGVHSYATKKKFTGIEDSLLEKSLYAWYLQKRSLGEPVSGTLLQEKAAQLNAKAGGLGSFKASNGWLHRFKQRHGIRGLSLVAEITPSDVAARDEFRARLAAFVGERGLGRDRVYNADETGLYWKSMPRKIAETTSGVTTTTRPRCESDARLTLMVCANASGSHKVPLLVVDKPTGRKSRGTASKLPVVYARQKCAWMDRNLFVEWYTRVFLPEVKKRQNVLGRREKILLLLDNAPSHPPVEELQSIDDMCQVMYLPPTTTALVQPMNRGIVEKLKILYKKLFLRELLAEDDEEDVRDFIRNHTVKNCCFDLARSWEAVTPVDVRNAWSKLLFDEDSPEETSDMDELLDLIRRVPGYTDQASWVRAMDSSLLDLARAWVREDSGAPVWKVLSDEEIINSIQGEQITVEDTEANFGIQDYETDDSLERTDTD